jgi:hypothetical protein
VFARGLDLGAEPTLSCPSAVAFAKLNEMAKTEAAIRKFCSRLEISLKKQTSFRSQNFRASTVRRDPGMDVMIGQPAVQCLLQTDEGCLGTSSLSATLRARSEGPERSNTHAVPPLRHTL